MANSKQEELKAEVSAEVGAHPDEYKDVGKWLDDYCSDKKYRERRKAERETSREELRSRWKELKAIQNELETSREELRSCWKKVLKAIQNERQTLGKRHSDEATAKPSIDIYGLRAEIRNLNRDIGDLIKEIKRTGEIPFQTLFPDAWNYWLKEYNIDICRLRAEIRSLNRDIGELTKKIERTDEVPIGKHFSDAWHYWLNKYAGNQFVTAKDAKCIILISWLLLEPETKDIGRTITVYALWQWLPDEEDEEIVSRSYVHHALFSGEYADRWKLLTWSALEQVKLQEQIEAGWEPLYFELNLANRNLIVGTRMHTITSEKVWGFLKTLAKNRKMHQVTPRIDGLNDWKNAYDMLRRLIGKIALKQMVRSSKGTYILDESVKIKRGGQVGIRRTKQDS